MRQPTKIEYGYVKCKGKYSPCKTTEHLKHGFRMVQTLERCCFEHDTGSHLLVEPALWTLLAPGALREQVPSRAENRSNIIPKRLHLVEGCGRAVNLNGDSSRKQSDVYSEGGDTKESG